jgi:iron(III) transport system ATP-binding protein
MTAPVIECLEVTKQFGDTLAVDRVSFSLEPGEILSILGPSGCGKTTMLRLIAGFEGLDGGEIRVEGRRVSTPRTNVSPEGRNVGMVFQDYSLFPHLNVAQNVLFGLSSLPRGLRRGRMGQVLDLVGLTSLEQRYPHELSGGQQQRVALARTLAPRPVALLLDEPFSNVDATMRADLRREVERILREDRVATMFVTHDREEAFAMADRVAVMRDGRLHQIDEPTVLYASPATPFVARASGVCDFLEGEVGGPLAVTELGELAWKSRDGPPPDGARVDVMVRSDDFRVQEDPAGESVVDAREFQGEDTLLVVRLPSGATVRCRHRDYSALAPGTRVSLSLARAQPFVAFAR